MCDTIDGLFILLPQTLPPFSLSVRFTQTHFPLQLEGGLFSLTCCTLWKLCIWIHVWRLCSHLFSHYQLADCQTHTVLSPRDTWATLQIGRCNLPTDWLALLSSCFSEVWNKLTYRSLVLLQTHDPQPADSKQCFSQIDRTDHEITQEWFDSDCTLTATHNFLFNVVLVNTKEALSTFSHTAVIMTEHLHAACFWKHWIRKAVSIWRLLVMQVCCRLHLSTRGSESVTESGKDGVRLSLFLERQRGSFTSFHSQTKVSTLSRLPARSHLPCLCSARSRLFSRK